MLNIEDKSKCCGCSACVNSCPTRCITMVEDEDGFLYPQADSHDCIECGLCEQVCPYNDMITNNPVEVYAARSSAHEPDSSSGGIVAALADKFINEGNVVYGAVFNEELEVVHQRTDTRDEVVRLMGSKYIQSDMGDAFLNVRRDLSQGIKVLFVGTPCQVAGLHSFLHGSPEGLTAVDLACHGVPGPGIWRKYLQAMKKKYRMEISSVSFRDKSKGWKNYHISYSDGCSCRRNAHDSDPYMLAYLQNLSMRLSCYDCPFRGSRCGDISAGDFWRVSDYVPDYDDGKGVSLVSVNTCSGNEVFKSLSEAELISYRAVPENVLNENAGFRRQMEIPSRRKTFLDGLRTTDDVLRHMEENIVRVSEVRRMYNRFHTMMSQIKKKFIR